MRTLKLQVQMSVDGYICGPNGEMDWMTLPWTEDLNAYVGKLTDPVDTIVLGRKLAQGFIPYWADVAGNPGDPEVAAGKKFTETQKIVFTKTLDPSVAHANGWNNTIVNNGDLATEIHRLKELTGNDIIAYGGAEFASGLLRHNLIDELHLLVNPAAIGEGKPIFRDGLQRLRLVAATPFECGIVALHYQKEKSKLKR